MNIITTNHYVAGIFAAWSDAQQYLAMKPAHIGKFVHTNLDLEYPFYLLEIGDGQFVEVQTEAEASALTGAILYTIVEDYQPAIPWADFMGELPHAHCEADLRNKAEAAYRDDAFPERCCDFCGRPYRGPAVYCCLGCAVADA